MSDADVTSVDGCYQDGLELARRAAYFEAHEAFELAWRACDPDERDFFQGLVHVVVSAYQRGRDKPVAAERQRLKALRRLAAFEPVHRGLDVRVLREALERAEPDPRKYLVERHLEPPVAPEEQE
jgi:predicted metal-dependent hydrolase